MLMQEDHEIVDSQATLKAKQNNNKKKISKTKYRHSMMVGPFSHKTKTYQLTTPIFRKIINIYAKFRNI